MVSRSCRLCLCLCLSPTSIRIRSHHRVLVMSHYTIASCLGPTAADAVGISAIFVACATFIQAAKLSSGYERTKSARSPFPALPDWCVMWTLIGSTSVARRRRRGRGRLGFNHSLWTELVQLPTCCRLRKTLWRLDQTDSNLNKVYTVRSMCVQQEESRVFIVTKCAGNEQAYLNGSPF